jgi:dienelactone hydrolase
MTQARLLALALCATSLAQDILLPPAPGPYDVTIRTTELIDYSREEILVPNVGHRRIMVSIYSPIPKGSEDCVSPYMTKAVADYESAFYAAAPPPLNIDFDFNRFKQPVCSYDVTYGSAENSTQGSGQNASSSFPLVIFGHGLGGLRFYYNNMMQDFASHGFIVANIDHPYDAHIVDYPDGSTVLASVQPGSSEHLEDDLASRSADASFVLDQMAQNCTLRNLVLAPQARVSSFEEVGIWGHSFGGAAAYQALVDDRRFQGAINIDGEMYGSVVGAGVDRPILFWADGDGLAHPNVTKAWPKFTDYRQMLVMEGSQHAGMMDAKLLLDLGGLNTPIFGTIDGALQTKTIVNYAVDFFRFVLLGEGLGLLEGPSEEYPHVTFSAPKSE